nr:hypothetical protein [Pandoravirus aubagnensis]
MDNVAVATRRQCLLFRVAILAPPSHGKSDLIRRPLVSPGATAETAWPIVLTTTTTAATLDRRCICAPATTPRRRARKSDTKQKRKTIQRGEKAPQRQDRLLIDLD